MKFLEKLFEGIDLKKDSKGVLFKEKNILQVQSQFEFRSESHSCMDPSDPNFSTVGHLTFRRHKAAESEAVFYPTDSEIQP